jgi:adenosine/AMP kinase
VDARSIEEAGRVLGLRRWEEFADLRTFDPSRLRTAERHQPTRAAGTTHQQLVELAVRNALAIGAGHSFVVFVREGFPVNVLKQLKQVAEVCAIFCATANPVEVVVAETEQGHGVLGVVDGEAPVGVETEQDVVARRELLRTLGYTA